MFAKFHFNSKQLLSFDLYDTKKRTIPIFGNALYLAHTKSVSEWLEFGTLNGEDSLYHWKQNTVCI